MKDRLLSIREWEQEIPFLLFPEVFGVGYSTVCNIVLEVSKLMIEVMWDVTVHFPATERDYINLINGFEKLWQFPYCFRAIDRLRITHSN